MPSLYANALLNNQVAFYDEVTEMVDRGSLHDVVYLGFCKAFDGPTQLPSLYTETRIWRENMDVVDKELAGGTQRVFVDGNLSSGRLRDLYWNLCSLISLSMADSAIKYPLKKVCWWHRAEQCSLHNRRERCHPGGPAQLWEVGPWESHKVQKVQVLFFLIRATTIKCGFSDFLYILIQDILNRILTVLVLIY